MLGPSRKQETNTSLLTPDPTFYPSPRMAMQAKPETLAYIALINPAGTGKPDALGVINVDSASKSYGRRWTSDSS